MKKILLTTLLFTSIAGYSQVKEQKKENQQSGDIIIESYEGEINNEERDITTGDLYEGTGFEDEPINYAALQVKPQFPGGEDALKKYIIDHIQKKNLKEGGTGKELKVILSFVIEKDGATSFPKLLKEPGFRIGEEMLRILTGLKTKWSPGMQNNKPVRANYILTILYTVPE
jgi:periplasmic protein TonB